ncbi:hypothetical protein YPPY10_0710, partial [Yersinia pestis PY-10]
MGTGFYSQVPALNHTNRAGNPLQNHRGCALPAIHLNWGQHSRY